MKEDYSTPILQPRGWQRALRYFLLAAAAMLFLAPALWMISASLKPDYEIFATPPTLWPKIPRWQNYSEALISLPFGRFAINTLIVAVSGIFGHLLSCSVVAYGFARLSAPGKGFFFILMLSTLMLPYPVTMVPLFILFSKLGWINSFTPLILPLSRPALATVAIFTFQAAWNDFLAPLIFLHDQSLYTLQLGLSLFRGAYNVQWAYLMAASLVVTLPVIAIFFFGQRSFIEGVGFTGTKI